MVLGKCVDTQVSRVCGGTCGTSNLGSTTHVSWWWNLWSGLTPVALVGSTNALQRMHVQYMVA
jgi:hypothetical protein